MEVVRVDYDTGGPHETHLQILRLPHIDSELGHKSWFGQRNKSHLDTNICTWGLPLTMLGLRLPCKESGLR